MTTDHLKNAFKAVMSHYPSGVVVVTTVDAKGGRHGFTATSFSSLSMDPPSVFVCLANTAGCYDAFVTAHHFAINLLGADDEGLARQFASRGIDKFADVDISLNAHEVPLLRSAAGHIECQAKQPVISGDHTILIGTVLAAGIPREREALVHYRRQFGHVRLPEAISARE